MQDKILVIACGAIAGILSSRSDNGEWEPGSETDPACKISLAPTLGIAKRTSAPLRPFGARAFT